MRILFKGNQLLGERLGDILRNMGTYQTMCPKYAVALKMLRGLSPTSPSFAEQITMMILNERPGFTAGVRSVRKLDVIGQEKTETHVRNLMSAVRSGVDKTDIDGAVSFARVVSICWPQLKPGQNNKEITYEYIIYTPKYTALIHIHT